MPLGNGLPVLDLFAIKLFLPLNRGQGAFGAVVTFLVAPRAAVSFDVVKKLALGVVGDALPVDRRVGVRSL